jgi:hypothetical protein
VTSESFGPFNKTAENNAIATLAKEFQPLRDLTPKSGAYINEARDKYFSSCLYTEEVLTYSSVFPSSQAFPFEKNWQQTFWGSNYARLLRIKREVDPTDVFWCSPCVGNERWKVRQDGQLCKI